MRRNLSLLLGAAAVLGLAILLGTRNRPSPVEEAARFFDHSGLEEEAYWLGGGGYNSGFLGFGREAHAEFVSRVDPSDRFTIRIQEAVPFAGWRLVSIDR